VADYRLAIYQGSPEGAAESLRAELDNLTQFGDTFGMRPLLTEALAIVENLKPKEGDECPTE
jgi:hypothetical protein